MKPKYVWCGVTPKGRVMFETTSSTKQWAWTCLLSLHFRDSIDYLKEQGYTVKKFRLEEVPE